MKRPTTLPSLCILESLGFLEESTHREGEIISRTLRLSGKESHYTYVRSAAEVEAFASEFGASQRRYLHLSCHGDQDGFATTTGRFSAGELARVLAPHVDRRRVFLSACQGAESNFARILLRSSECFSVVAPVGRIRFDDAAIFWSSFYHLVFKENPDSMTRGRIVRAVEKAANLVEEQFRIFYKDGDAVRSQLIEPGEAAPSGAPKLQKRS